MPKQPPASTLPHSMRQPVLLPYQRGSPIHYVVYRLSCVLQGSESQHCKIMNRRTGGYTSRRLWTSAHNDPVASLIQGSSNVRSSTQAWVQGVQYRGWGLVHKTMHERKVVDEYGSQREYKSPMVYARMNHTLPHSPMSPEQTRQWKLERRKCSNSFPKFVLR